MRLLTLLPWAIALVSYPSPSFSRAVVLPDTNLVSLPITVSIPDAILNGSVAAKTRDQPTAHDQFEDSPRFNRRAVIAPQQDKDIKDSDWDTAVAKGCKLNAAMLANDKEAAAMLGLTGDTAESTWKNYADLQAWGWNDDPNDGQILKSMNPIKLSAAFKGLGLNDDFPQSKTKDIVCNGLSHDKDTTHNNVEYEDTEAHFATVMNLEEGVLIAWQKYGPNYSAWNKGQLFNKPFTGELPKLKNWADVAFLQWKDQADKLKKDACGIRYFFSTLIDNNMSRFLAGRACKIANTDKKTRPDPEWAIIRGKECSQIPWDKKATFDASSDEGKALLASPNGRGAALMLITHKSTFGANRYIDQVTVWCEESQLNFMVRVHEKVPEKPDEPEHPDNPTLSDSLNARQVVARSVRVTNSSKYPKEIYGNGVNRVPQDKRLHDRGTAMTIPPPPVEKDMRDNYYDKMVGDGCNLMAAMTETNQKAGWWINKDHSDGAESGFTDYSEFASWGYEADPESTEFIEGKGLNVYEAFRAKKWPTDWSDPKSPNYEVDYKKHLKDTNHDEDNKLYPSTNARFTSLSVPEKGVLIACGAYYKNPDDKGNFPGPLPKLKNWHDVAFLQWKKMAENKQKDPRSLSYIVSHAVKSEESKAVLGRALQIQNRDKGTRPNDKWQVFREGRDCDGSDIFGWENAKTFETSTPEGKALLASPNGRGAALMLITHKSTFGERRFVESVTVWCEAGDPDREDDEPEYAEVHFMMNIRLEEDKPNDPDTELPDAPN